MYAVDRARHNIKSHDDLQELGHTTGELPVTAFHLATSAQVEDFMNEAFKRIAVRLTARNVIDHKLAVENHQEVNPTSDDRSATEGKPLMRLVSTEPARSERRPGAAEQARPLGTPHDESEPIVGRSFVGYQVPVPHHWGI